VCAEPVSVSRRVTRRRCYGQRRRTQCSCGRWSGDEQRADIGPAGLKTVAVAAMGASDRRAKQVRRRPFEQIERLLSEVEALRNARAIRAYVEEVRSASPSISRAEGCVGNLGFGAG
jgi:hypothetical protein